MCGTGVVVVREKDTCTKGTSFRCVSGHKDIVQDTTGVTRHERKRRFMAVVETLT